MMGKLAVYEAALKAFAAAEGALHDHIRGGSAPSGKAQEANVLMLDLRRAVEVARARYEPMEDDFVEACRELASYRARTIDGIKFKARMGGTRVGRGGLAGRGHSGARRYLG